MKKTITIILILLLCFALGFVVGRIIFNINPENPSNVSGEAVESGEVVIDDYEVSLSAIRNALKDDEWVKENVMMKNDCFGEEASGDQELTFRMVGKNRVVVQAFSYDEVFGIAETIVAYKDGEVVTYSHPELTAPDHPGHIGYGVCTDKELMVGYFMHMGYYGNYYYSIGDNFFEEIARFEGSEYGEDGELNENESGDIIMKTQFTIDGVEESGDMTFKEFENRLDEYTKGKDFEPIDIPLTDENIDKYIK